MAQVNSTSSSSEINYTNSEQVFPTTEENHTNIRIADIAANVIDQTREINGRRIPAEDRRIYESNGNLIEGYLPEAIVNIATQEEKFN